MIELANSGKQMARLIPATAATSAAPNCWYAAYTCGHHERRVAEQLEARGFEYFLPTYRSVRQWKDRRKELQVALFPSYVFVRMTLRERLAVLQVPGVVDLVSFAGVPAPLPDPEIEALRNGISDAVKIEPHPYLRVGRRVRIACGPLAGIEGILVRRKNNLRVVISIALIRSSVAVEVAENDVAPER